MADENSDFKMKTFKLSELQKLRSPSLTKEPVGGPSKAGLAGGHSKKTTTTPFQSIESLLDTKSQPEVMGELQSIMDELEQHMENTQQVRLKAIYKKGILGTEQVMVLLAHLFEVKTNLIVQSEQTK
jgi:hypothetical protein